MSVKLKCDQCRKIAPVQVFVAHKSIIRLNENGRERYFKRGEFCSPECFRAAFENPDSWFEPTGLNVRGNFGKDITQGCPE